MGLASQLKLQQASGGAPAGGAPPGYPPAAAGGAPPPGQQQQAPGYPGYPPQGGAYPSGGPMYGSMPQAMGQPGAYPPQQGGYPAPGYPPQQAGYPPAAGYPPMQQGYPPAQAYPGAAPGGAPFGARPAYPQGPQGMESVIGAKLQKIVEYNQLQRFYPPQRLQAVTQQVACTVDFDALAARWRMPKELAVDLASLALYDIVIYGDDSGSMESYDGESIEDLKLIMSKVAEVATLFDSDGIEVRFINANVQGNNIRNGADAERLLRGLEYRYDTKLATQMEAKILHPMAYARPLQKPLLIITITDGEPSEKPKDKIVQVIMDCRQRLAPQYGPKAVAFAFAQVGKDQEAQQFLAYLDNHPQVGNSIDCTSYYELEQMEYAKKGVQLSVEAWLVKLLVGAIDPSYDEQDE